MSFTDTGILLDARPHGETHAVAHVFTEHNGVRAGLVYGGQGRKMRALLQPGNEVAVDWKGREDSLGHFTLELTGARAAEAMSDRLSLAGLAAACATARAILPEREEHRRSYHGMAVLLNNIGEIEFWPALMARWELGLLAELGFGLTLDRCAASGGADELIYVSPRSACAVSASAGAPYKDKMLPLPAFFHDAERTPTRQDALDGLKTTGYFIETRILHLSDKTLPEARQRVVDLLRAEL